MIDTDAFLLASRFVTHMVTAAVIFAFQGEGMRFRGAISGVAWIMMGSSLALAMQIATKWETMLAGGPQPWLVIFSATVMMAVIYSRGNIAKWFAPFRRA